MLTQAQLKEVLQYDPDTGEFVWLKQRGWRSDLIGKRAGKTQNKGYRAIRIYGEDYLAHRLAWLYMKGYFPKGDLDHKNRNKTDNRISNLRLATRSQNLANSKRRSSVLKGAFWDKRQKRWFSSIGHKYRSIYLGTFPTAKEAHAAYCKAANELHGDFFYIGKE